MSEAENVQAWRTILARHAAVTCALERELQDGHALSVSEFEVLERLAEAPASMRVQEVAAAVHLSQSATTRVVARLEADGLVERCMCPEDRRGVQAVLTPAGRDRHAEAIATQRGVLARELA